MNSPQPQQSIRPAELIVESRNTTLFTPASWNELMRGDGVVLIGHERQRDAGTVDTVSKDGSFLWIMHCNGHERRLFLKGEVSRTVVDLKDLERRNRGFGDG